MSGALQTDLITALATAPGQGGIGVIRLSGPGALALATQVVGQQPKPRQATFCQFLDGEEVIDEGLVLCFAKPASFTGEDVVELQGHGGPVVMQRLLDLTCRLGARLARPGEFSERAFTNGKLDLAQAEAVADLISSTSVAAARAAVRSLQGDFSTRVNQLTEDLAKLRILVEACIDFPDEDVEFLQDGQVHKRTQSILQALQTLLRETGQGRLLNEGAAVALVGAPNAGKSSLLNLLSGEQAAIVTDIPGTTRDLLKVDLVVDGLPIRLVDTAGLRESADEVEKLGVQRAKTQAGQADLILVVLDATAVAATAVETSVEQLLTDVAPSGELRVILNKVDLLSPAEQAQYAPELIKVSALTAFGLLELRNAISSALGFEQKEAGFIARARHVEALEQAAFGLSQAIDLLAAQQDTEIVAEELRNAHNALGEIVGTVTPDDLLGRIFSEFCIGK